MGVSFITAFLFVALSFSVSTAHWTLTENETIWRDQYKNCDKGYAVDLPDGAVGHGSLPPAPNHGILIAANHPDSVTEVTFAAPRVVGVYDFFDAAEYGSAKAYAKHILAGEGHVEILANAETKFRGLPAAHIHFRKTGAAAKQEVEELVVYRQSGDISPIFYVIWLRSTSGEFGRDRKLYEQVRDGFHLLPAPVGECSNN